VRAPVCGGFRGFEGPLRRVVNPPPRGGTGGDVPAPPAGTPLSRCYPPPSVLGEILRSPEIAGILYSLVGPEPLFDHQYVHVREPREGAAQHLHGDSTIDLRMHFDVQLMYFPHAVSLEMGGTLLVPGSHFRRINESDIGRYQNIVGQVRLVCEAGTILGQFLGGADEAGDAVAVLQGQVQQLGAGLAGGAEDEATHVRVSW